MKIGFFSTQLYDKKFFDELNEAFSFSIDYYETSLNEQTVNLLHDVNAVCVFVNDLVNRSVIEQLASSGIKIIALRCAGFNNVDLHAAADHNIIVVRVPSYSPHAVAEHAVAMIMTLNRKTHKAYNRVREQNFSLNGLLGFDLFGKTVGVVGTGNIGQVFCSIMLGFGMNVLAYDVHPNNQLIKSGVQYVTLLEVFKHSDIISLHCPLNEQTRHLINDQSVEQLKRGVMLINTSRGALVDAKTAIKGLKSGLIGFLGIDVYEQEETLFFRDLSEKIIVDDVIARLNSFPNVLITAHQGFFTKEALNQIAQITLSNLKAFEDGESLVNQVKL